MRTLALALAAAAAAQAQTRIEPAQAAADFALFRTALTEAHPGLYRYAPKHAVDAAIFAAEREARQARTVEELARAVAAAAAAVHCGNTGLVLDAAVRRLAEQRFFPLRLRIEGNRAWEAGKSAREVLYVNTESMAGILRRLRAHLPGDGDIETGKTALLNRSFALAYRLFINSPAGFRVQFRGGAEENIGAVPAPPAAEIPEPRLALEVKAATAVMTLGSLAAQDLPEFLERSFAEIRRSEVESLIIDVRGNAGGSDRNSALLASYLLDREFRPFERIAVRARSFSFLKYTDTPPERLAAVRLAPDAGLFRVIGGGVQKPQPAPFRGRVFVLIDGGTFGAAADFCALLRSHSRATFIGEETGGAYRGGNGGLVLTLKLPNSGLRVRIPTWAYYNAVEGDPAGRRGVFPDHPSDQALETALKLVDSRAAR